MISGYGASQNRYGQVKKLTKFNFKSRIFDNRYKKADYKLWRPETTN